VIDPKMNSDHQFQSHVVWSGSTGIGYRAYSRDHTAVAPPAVQEVRLSAGGGEFLGDPELLNPEQLIVVAASSCLLLTFLAVAALTGIDVVGYDDKAQAFMPSSPPPQRITEVTLAPHIRVRGKTSPDQVVTALRQAHARCFVANSLSATTRLLPTVEHVDEPKAT
jgi:organic hydroperoxide reductase OsmC/OhrA